MKAAAKNALRRLIRTGMDIAPVRRQVRALAHAGLVPKKIWNRLPIAEDPFLVVLPGGATFRYRTAPGDSVAQAFYWRGVSSWEASTIRVFLELAGSARLFVDVGANTGPYSLLACTANPALRAIAYEPVPRVHERLVENIACNGYQARCTLRTAAVSDTRGTTKLHVPNTRVPSSASLEQNGFRGLSGELIDVEVTTIDADLAGERVDLVKIDVEGFEDRVLLGMRRVLAEDRPIIICECNPDGPYQAVDAILGEHGYAFFHLRDPGPVATQRIEPDAEERYRNYACVPSENGAALAAMSRAGERA